LEDLSQGENENQVRTTPLILLSCLRPASGAHSSAMPDGTKLAEFIAWCRKNITGDEKGQAQT
jgi:hypothetical protein